jgi:hypothetical protein
MPLGQIFVYTNIPVHNIQHIIDYALLMSANIWTCHKIVMTVVYVGRDSVVSVATCYGLDGPGIESQWVQDFLHPLRLVLGTT